MASNYTTYPYNLTELHAATTMSDVTAFANTASGGMLMGGVMIAVFFVALMILKRYSSLAEALAVSGYLCFIISAVLVLGNMINFLFPLVFLIIAALATLYLYAKE